MVVSAVSPFHALPSRPRPRRYAWQRQFAEGSSGISATTLVHAALAAEDRAPEILVRLGEEVGRLLLDDPRRLLELGLELSRAPAGVAGEHPRSARRAGQLVEVAVARDESDVADDEHRGVLRVVELGEHEHGLLLHRPADEDALVVVDERQQVGDGVRDRGLRRAG